MSHTTEEKPQLLIDLTNARHATALDASSILHRMQIEAFLDRVSEVVGRVESFSAKLKQGSGGHNRSVSYERYHDVITLHGKRGSGKTTFLLSALELLQDPAKRKVAFPRRFENNADNDGLNGLCVLEILDPTLFGLHEHLLLSLMAKIAFEVRSTVGNNERNLCGGHNGQCKLEEWENRLRQFAKALKHMGETRDDLDTPLPKETVEWEDSQFIFEQNMENAQRSFGLEREFHKFLHDSLKLIDKKAFVLALDDIDTRPQIGWHVLEVLRRYFTSPQLVVVLSGDMDLFKTIIEKHQLKIFDLNFASDTEVRKEFKSRIDGLTEQYLLKILRTPSRINLGSFQAAVKQWMRRYPKVTLSVKKGHSELLFDAVLNNYFFEFLACYSGFEQKLFQQALFLNPARTVTQVFDVLLGHWHEGFVERMREIFLVSLQNLGIERPFDLAEALQNPQGVNLLMEQLFSRGYVSYGLELLPTRQNQDENNALLALHAELVFALQNNPAVLFAFALKACLLREVLLLQSVEASIAPYAKLERFLGLEMQEQPSVTAARIAALHWGQPSLGSVLRSVGNVRLYSKTIMKDMPTAAKVMYGSNSTTLTKAKSNCPEELSRFCSVVLDLNSNKDASVSVLVNTPETLCINMRSWQSDIVYAGIVDVRMRNETYRAFSIFPLLSIMCDIIEADENDVARIFRKYSEIINTNAFTQSGSATFSKEDFVDLEDVNGHEEGVHAVTEHDRYKIFIESLVSWVRSCKRRLKWSSPVALCARVMSRYFSALEKIHSSRNRSAQSTFVGEYIHRCLVSFFNSVLVEEYLLSAKQKQAGSSVYSGISLDNPTTSDAAFLKNLMTSQALTMVDKSNESFLGESYLLSDKILNVRTEGFEQAVNSISKDYPFFKAVFSCPLWSLYLKPDYLAGDGYATTVFEIYMGLLNIDPEEARKMSAVAYGADVFNFENLYHVLNSLAIPKPEQGVARSKGTANASRRITKLETRTEVGIALRMPKTPDSIKFKKVLAEGTIRNDILVLLRLFEGTIPPAFSETYEGIVRHLYKNNAVIQQLTGPNHPANFWAFAKKNLKP